MTQKVILPLNGAMNKDVAPAYIKSEQGEVFERRNARVVSVAGSKTAYNTSLKGTTLLGSYTNHVALGSIEDIKNARVLFFLKDISNSDKIISVSRPQGNSTTHTITTLFESTVFNFNVNYPIDADIIDDYLVFTDAINPPRKLYIGSDRLTTLDANNIQLAVRPPSSAPTISWGSDLTRKINLMLGKSWQFATQYIYRGYEYSVLSQYSKVAISPSVFINSDQTYLDSNLGNFITVGCNLGTDDVREVKIYAREGNSGGWFLVDKYEKSNEPENTPYSFNFYNDKARQYISTSEALAFYSDVPLKAQSVLAVKNRVGLAGITKGFNNDEISISVNYSVTYNDVTLNTSSTELEHGSGTAGDSLFIGWNIPNTLNEGDTITVKFDRTSITVFYPATTRVYKRINLSYSFSHLVAAGETESDIIDMFVSDIISKGNSISPSTLPSGVQIYASANANGYDVSMDILGIISAYSGYTVTFTEAAAVFSYDVFPSGVSTFKAGSYYNVGIIFYDDFGRTSGVIDEQRIYIPSNGERDYADANKQAIITFSIDEETVVIPSWAKYYRFAFSESVNILSVFPFVSGTESGNNLVNRMFIDNKKVTAINIPTNVSYEFVKGDYLFVEYDNGTSITSEVKSIVGVRNVISTVINVADEGDPVDMQLTDLSGYWLIIPGETKSVPTYENTLCYIYRPKTEGTTTVYYEDYRTYYVNNGVIGTNSGVVGDGDAWFMTRSYQWDEDSDPKTDQVVEDFVVSVDDALRAYSKGRAIVEFDDLGKQQEFQHFVWSKQYLDNTKINGLAFFESTARVELDEKNGRIARVKLVGDVIKCVQTNKETSMYVGKQQISNADGTLSLVSTANFIGTVYPSDENTGTNYKKSVIVNDRNLYYWDGKRGEVIRSAPNGQFPISSSNMKSYFYYLKTQLDGAYWSDVVFHFDNRYNELVCTFSWRRTSTSIFNSETLVYSEDIGGWTYFYDLRHDTTSVNIGSDIYGKIGEANYAFNYGKLWELDSNTANNTIFNAVKPLSIIPYVNIAPASEKCLKSVETDSNLALTASFDSDVANTRPLGNYTYLVPASFRNREGLFASAINRNIRTSLGNNVSLLYSGNLMTGKYFKATLSNNTAGEVEIRLMTVGYVPSA